MFALNYEDDSKITTEMQLKGFRKKLRKDGWKDYRIQVATGLTQYHVSTFFNCHYYDVKVGVWELIGKHCYGKKWRKT